MLSLNFSYGSHVGVTNTWSFATTRAVVITQCAVDSERQKFLTALKVIKTKRQQLAPHTRKNSVNMLYSPQKQLPENIARAFNDNWARLHFARQLFLWEVYMVCQHSSTNVSEISYCFITVTSRIVVIISARKENSAVEMFPLTCKTIVKLIVIKNATFSDSHTKI